jgi:hypothetical protein
LRDTFGGYAEFLANFSHDPMAKRVRALLAARREAITWRRTYQANVPEAYWTYAKRYPRGPHRADASRLLAHLGAAIEPPSKFATVDYDMPTPLPDELEYIGRPVLAFDDSVFAFQPPPRSPVYFLEPPPSEILALQPPAPPYGSHSLPRPANIPLPAYVSAPSYVLASTGSLVFNDDPHKTLVANNTQSIANTPDRQAVSSSPTLPAGMAADRKDIAGDSAPPPRSTREKIKALLNEALPGMSLPALPDGESLAAAPTAALAHTPDKKASPVPGPEMPAPQASGSILFRHPAIISPHTIGSMPPSQPLPTDAQADKKPPSVPDAQTLAPPAIGSIPSRIPAISSANVIGSMPNTLLLPGVSSRPGLPTDDQTWATGRIATLAPTTDNRPPVPGSEMLAPPATGSIPPLIPAILSPPATGSIPIPIPRPVALAPPATGSSLRRALYPLTWCGGSGTRR